ncbi:hypothetical protein SDC9_85599 [bioreactor metagenome]|uniref:Uncharacterized protein n=1 Tax=bioreactor metagenome TaxID=1076179 RepID=A0A644ZF94_9ZZZZ
MEDVGHLALAEKLNVGTTKIDNLKVAKFKI